MKFCNKCSQWKPFEDFNKSSREKDSLQSKCKKCAKYYYDKNKETKKVQRQQYYEANKDVLTFKSRQYTREHVEENRNRAKSWARHNSERVKKNMAAWRTSNPDKKRRLNADYRARKLSVLVESVDHMKVFERDSWICQVCFLPVDKNLIYPNTLSPSLDHKIPLIKGGEHSYSNVQLAHLSCNCSKKDRVK